MKSSRIYISTVFIFLLMGTQSAFSNTQEEIRSKNTDFRNVVKIETQQYDDALIKNVYLEHRRKTKKSGTKDYLYVKGSFKNLRRTILAGAQVRARFYDADGNLLEVKQDAVIPRIMRQYRKNRGHFTLKVSYDPEIVLCKLDATWSGKEED